MMLAAVAVATAKDQQHEYLVDHELDQGQRRCWNHIGYVVQAPMLRSEP